MKVLFIGLGSISTKHIRDLVTVTNLKGIDCNITILRRKITDIPEDLRDYNIKQITELDNTFYDIAFITNPTNKHYEVLEQLQGKASYYFIEKPIFDNPNYKWESLGLTSKNSYIACPLRHSQVYKELKKIVDSNKVFSARIICSSYLPEWRPDIDYRKNYSAIKALGGGVTLDLIHELDYMVGLFGIPEKVYNIHGKYSNLEIDSDDLSIYIAKYTDKLCEVHLDYFGRKYQRKCEVYTSKCTYIADFKEESIITSDGKIFKCSNNGKSNLLKEMEYFIDFVTGKELNNVNPPETGVEVLKITLGETDE